MQLDMTSDGAVEKEGARGDAKHHSGQLIYNNTRDPLEGVSNPKEVEKFTISRRHRNHEKCLLNVSCDGDSMYSEVNPNVKDSLVKFWSWMETVVQ